MLISDVEKQEVTNLIEPLDVENEKEVSAKLDVSLFKAETVIEDEDIPEGEDQSECFITVPYLPSFHINGKNYIFLSHV